MDWNEWRHSALMMAQKDFLYLKREDFDKLDALVRSAEAMLTVQDDISEFRPRGIKKDVAFYKLQGALKNLGIGGGDNVKTSKITE